MNELNKQGTSITSQRHLQPPVNDTCGAVRRPQDSGKSKKRGWRAKRLSSTSKGSILTTPLRCQHLPVEGTHLRRCGALCIGGT
jgi:hypothetical protein